MMTVELGLVDFDHLAIDGQSIHASANLTKTYNMERLQKRYEKVRKGIEHILSESVDGEISEKDLERHEKLEKQSQKLDALKGLLKQCEEAGEKNPERNMTDPEALNLKFKDKTIKPSYNHQSAVDSKHGITVAVQTVNHPDHGDDLFPLVDKAAENAQGNFHNVLADSAFINNESYDKIDKRVEEFYVPDKSFVAAQRDNKSKRYKKIDFQRNDDDEIICPAGRLMVKMRQKLISREGKLIYQKRQGTVEPTHGHTLPSARQLPKKSRLAATSLAGACQGISGVYSDENWLQFPEDFE